MNFIERCFTTDAAGTVKFTLPEGNFRFRTDLHGAQYFSSTENDCTVTTCTTSAISVPVYGQVTVTAQSSAGLGQADLPVYAFDGDTYTGISGVTGKDGKTTLWLPAGNYRFRVDQFNLQFFSGDENHCTIPSCTSAVVKTLGIQQETVDQTIDYTYDPLNRLTQANYDDGRYFTYTYDAVGNRLTGTTKEKTDTYIYAANNRISSVNGTYYGYDGIGNLRWDGKYSYSYDGANHLTQLYDTVNAKMYTYSYDGLGDLMNSSAFALRTNESTSTNYVQDIAGGLSQVLSDGTNTYLYGYNRISQTNADTEGYFLDDAIGSVRQVAGIAASSDAADSDPELTILVAQSFSTYGEVIDSVGTFETSYGFTGEMTDDTGLINLRARWYAPGQGRFISKDSWNGDYKNPITLVKWVYANANPVMYVDPSGKISQNESSEANQIVSDLRTYGILIDVDWGEYYNFVNPFDHDTSGLKNTTCGWNSGSWDLGELYIVEGAVENLNSAMQHKMKNFLGEVSFSRDTTPCDNSNNRGCTSLGNIQLKIGKKVPSSLPMQGNILNYEIQDDNINFDQWSVVHELGHAWDYLNNHSLALGLVTATNGILNKQNPNCNGEKWLPGCNNANYYYGDFPPKGAGEKFNYLEDFAESVAAYVFPVVAQRTVEKNYGLNSGTSHEKRAQFYYSDYTKTKRWFYINTLINGNHN